MGLMKAVTMTMMTIEPLRILVADDEPLASDRLNLLLGRVEGVGSEALVHG